MLDNGCKNNTKNLSTKKVSKHKPSDFPMSSFNNIENMHDIY